MRLQPIDWVVVVLYILFVLGIGVLAARRAKTSDDLFGPDFHRLERASFPGA
jgi:Na+/proline symporter